MHKLLISVSDELASRLRIVIPARQRSKVIASLIAKEVEQRENRLYACALEVEQDVHLNEEMHAWDLTISDGVAEA